MADVLVLFETALGPMATLEAATSLKQVWVGYRTVDRLRREFRRFLPGIVIRDHSDVSQLLSHYATGDAVDFDAVRLDATELSPFRRRVVNACRSIGYGQTLDYSALARRAGAPLACRAVGSTMARNRCPIVVPCHRVLRRDGSLGGYSAPQGLAFKRRLLRLEGAE